MNNLDELSNVLENYKLTSLVESDETVKNEVTILILITFIMGLLTGLLFGAASKGLKLNIFSNNTIKNKGNGTYKKLDSGCCCEESCEGCCEEK